MALTGLAMTAFLVAHLSGNLLLLLPSSVAFNSYAHKLEQMEVLVILVDIALLVFLIKHVLTGFSIARLNKTARPQAYAVVKPAGEPSRKSLASSLMPLSGITLLLFIIWHIATFKFGPGIQEGYVTQINGSEVRDLHRLVAEEFQKPAYVIGYVFCMLLLTMHLFHGVRSAFQSLGVNHVAYNPVIRYGSQGLALLLGLGFTILPVWIFICG